MSDMGEPAVYLETSLVPVIEMLQEQVINLVNRVTALEHSKVQLVEECIRLRALIEACDQKG